MIGGVVSAEYQNPEGLGDLQGIFSREVFTWTQHFRADCG
jgi:hypothetical protein